MSLRHLTITYSALSSIIFIDNRFFYGMVFGKEDVDMKTNMIIKVIDNLNKLIEDEFENLCVHSGNNEDMLYTIQDCKADLEEFHEKNN